MKRAIFPSLIFLVITTICNAQDNEEFIVTHGPYLQNPGNDGVTVVGTPVLVNSHVSFVEVEADAREIKAVVKDVNGKIIQTYVID